MIIEARKLSELKCSRAGVILYTRYRGKYYFLLARDRQTQELGDFGGGRKNNESALDAALRELTEEGNQVFDNEVIKTLDHAFAIYDNRMAIIFLPLCDKKWLYLAQYQFGQKENEEVSGVVWVQESKFYDLVFREKNEIWSKVRNFILTNVHRNELVKTISKHYPMDVTSGLIVSV